jgi:hypothetical protein
MNVFRRPFFWLLFAVASLAAALFAREQFSRAFPILDQPLTMSRETATAAALQLAKANGWEPSEGARSATRLWDDRDLTTFIELEAGGKQNLAELLHDGTITPYRWQVRLFQEKNAAETVLQFRPDGRFLGFHEKLPETQVGPKISAETARQLAEIRAAALGLSLQGYTLAETKSDKVGSGRLDHSFTYERTEPRLGAGRDQVVLTVRGDRFCGAEPKVKLPDDFFRRYAAMRASNTNLQLAANVGFFLLFGLGGCVGGLIYLSRKRAIAWRGALVAAGTLALVAFASALSMQPLAWFGYDTALSSAEFQFKAMLAAVLGCLFMLVFAPILAAAEGLGRLAFPQHPLLWQSLSRGAAGSRTVVGAVLASYGATALFFAYEVVMARFGTERLGWWLPSSTRFDPGLLASSCPWIAPLANSFTAGLTEECLFRALPLAAAVLLGRRFGRPRLWVGVLLVVQALVFGAAHSSYPTMPGWARMVELLLPALCFGALYLRFGLLPGILTHFLYDLVWMGMPLFADHAPGTGLNIAILMTVGLAPLAWVVFCRIRIGACQELSATLRNGGWVRREKLDTPPPQSRPTTDLRPANTTALRAVFAVGILALAIWAISMWRAVPSMPGLSLRKTEAIAQAHAVLTREGVLLGPEWDVRPLAHSDSDNERLFVWQTSGETEFQALAGNALALPGWRIRFLRPDLALPDRAEEYHVFLTGDGHVQRYGHILPESRTGAQLTRAEAQTLAEQELARVYGVPAASLELVSANETKLPARSDWRFIWKDPKSGLQQGESRLWITLAGDRLCGYERHVFIPEEWTRARASEDNARNLTTGMLNFALFATLLIAVVLALRHVRNNPFLWRAAFVTIGLFVVTEVVQFFVKLPSQQAWMATNESLQTQTLRGAAALLIGILFSGTFFGTLAGLGCGKNPSPKRAVPEYLAGLGAGFILLCAERLGQCLIPSWHPWHAGIDSANSGLPALGSLWVAAAFVPSALGCLRVYMTLPKDRERQWLRKSLLLALGLAYGATLDGSNWLSITILSLLFGVSFVLLDRLIQRTHPSVIVAIVTARFLGKAIGDCLIPGHLDAIRDGLVAAALVLAYGGVLFRALQPTPAAPPSLPPENVSSCSTFPISNAV